MVTCSVENPSSVIVYEWQRKIKNVQTIILSTRIPSLALDIFALPYINNEKKESNFDNDFEEEEVKELDGQVKKDE